jgi:hypothetical protein
MPKRDGTSARVELIHRSQRLAPDQQERRGDFMQRLIVALTVSVVLASGCAIVGKQIDPRTGVDGYDPALVTRPRPTAPNVFIDRNDFLVVDQEPIRVFRSKPKNESETVEVVWALPARSNYTFTSDGIRFTNPPPELKCKSSGKRFACSFLMVPDRMMTYKYEVTVMDGQRRLQVLDPTVVSMP